MSVPFVDVDFRRSSAITSGSSFENDLSGEADLGRASKGDFLAETPRSNMLSPIVKT